MAIDGVTSCMKIREVNKNKKQFVELRKSEFIKEDMDETVFMFALFKCRKFDKRRN